MAGVTIPCAWCFLKTTGVIKLAAYDVDETDAAMGVRLNGEPPYKTKEIVCAGCLRKDRSARAERAMPVEKKLLHGPTGGSIRAALRAGVEEDEEDEEAAEEAEEEIRLTEKILKPLKKKDDEKKKQLMSTDPPKETKEARKKRRKW